MVSETDDADLDVHTTHYGKIKPRRILQRGLSLTENGVVVWRSLRYQFILDVIHKHRRENVLTFKIILSYDIKYN